MKVQVVYGEPMQEGIGDIVSRISSKISSKLKQYSKNIENIPKTTSAIISVIKELSKQGNLKKGDPSALKKVALQYKKKLNNSYKIRINEDVSMLAGVDIHSLIASCQYILSLSHNVITQFCDTIGLIPSATIFLGVVSSILEATLGKADEKEDANTNTSTNESLEDMKNKFKQGIEKLSGNIEAKINKAKSIIKNRPVIDKLIKLIQELKKLNFSKDDTIETKVANVKKAIANLKGKSNESYRMNEDVSILNSLDTTTLINALQYIQAVLSSGKEIASQVYEFLGVPGTMVVIALITDILQKLGIIEDDTKTKSDSTGVYIDSKDVDMFVNAVKNDAIDGVCNILNKFN